MQDPLTGASVPHGISLRPLLEHFLRVTASPCHPVVLSSLSFRIQPIPSLCLRGSVASLFTERPVMRRQIVAAGLSRCMAETRTATAPSASTCAVSAAGPDAYRMTEESQKKTCGDVVSAVTRESAVSPAALRAARRTAANGPAHTQDAHQRCRSRAAADGRDLIIGVCSGCGTGQGEDASNATIDPSCFRIRTSQMLMRDQHFNPQSPPSQTFS